MDEVTLTLEGLAHLLNIGHDEVKTLLTNEGTLIEDPKVITEKTNELHDQNLIGFRNSRTKAFDDGYKKAQKKVLEDKESEYREKYDVEGETIDDIVEGILESGKKTAKTNPQDVKNSQTYIDDTKAYKKRISDLENELESEKDGRESDRVNSEVDTMLPGILEKNKKVLSDKDEERDQQLNLIRLQLESQGVKLRNVNGEILPFQTTDDGEVRMTDEKTMKDLSLSDVILANSLFLPTAENAGGQSPGNRNDSGGGDPSYNFQHVKTGEELLSEMEKLEGKEDADQEMDALIAHGEALGL